MGTTFANLFALVAVSMNGVGSRGPVKYSNVTISKVRKGYWSVSVTYPKFQSVTAVTSLANHELLKFANGNIREWVSNTTKDMEKPRNAWTSECTPMVVTARAELVSLRMTQYFDTEGAHPNTVHQMLNYGFVGNGAKVLTLRDLFRPGVNGLALVSKIVIAKLKEREAAWVVEGTVKALDKKQGDEFVIKPDRLTYIFSPYEMGSYAEGTYEVDVPFVALGRSLNPNGPLRQLLKKPGT